MVCGNEFHGATDVYSKVEFTFEEIDEGETEMVLKHTGTVQTRLSLSLWGSLCCLQPLCIASLVCVFDTLFSPSPLHLATPTHTPGIPSTDKHGNQCTETTRRGWQDRIFRGIKQFLGYGMEVEEVK